MVHNYYDIIKGLIVYNGKSTREWLSKEYTTSPTVVLDSLMLMMTIDANIKKIV